MSALTLLEAIHDGLAEELRRDPKVFLIGEDIATYGGAFKVTEGLVDEFGKDRIVDTPLAEAAVLGGAVGAAMMGMRPVAEMQFMDFVTTCGFDQLVSVAAKSRYRNGVGVPLVVRGPVGGGNRGGPYHSVCPEQWFTTVPGLKVVMPSTAYDAKGLIKAAIRDPDPVIFLEHKYLYRRVKDEVPAHDYIVPLGEGATRREGTDAAILTYGAMSLVAQTAADQFAKSTGKEVRVIDLRSLVPLDVELVTRAARETGRVLIVHEHPKTGGFAGELMALIHEHAFDYLDAPLMRVTAPDTPVPYAPTLEDAYLPQVVDVVRALEALLTY